MKKSSTNKLTESSNQSAIKKQDNSGLNMFTGKFPYFDIDENDNALCLSADVPELNENNIKVTFRDGYLILKGEKHGCSEESFDNYYYSESWSGSFSRSFPLGEGLDTSRATTSCKNGRLVINIPKKQKVQLWR